MFSLSIPQPQLSRHWRLPLLTVVSLILLLLVSYRETATAMVAIWIRSETFTHAFVVPPIVLWLIWRMRDELAALQPRPMPLMLLPMAGLAMLWWLGDLVNVAAATQLAITAMIVVAVPLMLGWGVTRAMAFPLAFTFFAVPIGEFLTPLLMHWTAEVLVASLRMTGIPVYQEGQQLVIPSGRWAVVEACSGIRYLMATFMVGSLFAYLNYRSTRRRVIFVAVSIVLPVIANWLRAYIIVMLGHLSNNEIATGVDHIVYGWVFFGIVIMGLFFVGARWSEDDLPDPMAAARVALAAAAPAAPAWHVMLLAACTLLLVQWPLWSQQSGGAASNRQAVQLQLPAELGAWKAQGGLPVDWAAYHVGVSVEQSRAYQGPLGQVVVQVAYYHDQGDDAKLVSSANRLIAPGNHRWHVTAQGRVGVPAKDGLVQWRTATVVGAESDGSLTPGRARLSVRQIYWIGGHLAQNDVQAKLLQAWLAVLGEPDDGASVVLYTTLTDDAAADRLLAAFIRENFNILERTLAQARQGR